MYTALRGSPWSPQNEEHDPVVHSSFDGRTEPTSRSTRSRSRCRPNKAALRRINAGGREQWSLVAENPALLHLNTVSSYLLFASNLNHIIWYNSIKDIKKENHYGLPAIQFVWTMFIWTFGVLVAYSWWNCSASILMAYRSIRWNTSMLGANFDFWFMCTVVFVDWCRAYY
jgi:hypothetical protein